MQASISVLIKYISGLNKSELSTLSDKLLLLFVKLIYIIMRIILLVLGKKKKESTNCKTRSRFWHIMEKLF